MNVARHIRPAQDGRLSSRYTVPHAHLAGERLPEHARVFAYARGEGAALVARGVFPLAAVQEALVIALGRPADGTHLRCEIAWALRDAVAQLEHWRCRVRHDVAKAMGPLLDAQWPLETVLRAAGSADPDGLFSPVELADLVVLEATWWIRLHTVLDEAERP